jgi:hypothetical protein
MLPSLWRNDRRSPRYLLAACLTRGTPANLENKLFPLTSILSPEGRGGITGAIFFLTLFDYSYRALFPSNLQFSPINAIFLFNKKII